MTRFSASFETWAFRGLVLIVALAPLPLGGNRPLPAGLIALGAGLLLLLWALHAALRMSPADGSSPRIAGRRLLGPGVLFLAVLAWIGLQWLPLPFASQGDPLWAEAATALGRELAPRIGINPSATLAALSNLIAYGAVFWLALQMTVDPGRARQARGAIVAIGSVYCVYGLFAWFGGADWLFGRLFAPQQDSLISTFVNRNSFATFAGLALLAAVTVFLDRIRHILALARPARQKAALVIETMVFQARWTTAAMLAIALALFLTTSRGGIFAALIALAGLTMLQLQSGAGGRNRRGPVALLVLIVVGIALVIGGGNFLERVERQGLSIENDLRSTIFATTIEAIRTTPWTGTGFGTYAEAIEAYRGNDPEIFTRWKKAHNTYLENALELGLPAALALNLAILWLAIICFRGVRERRRNRAYPALGVAATLLVGLHALVDFSLQIPAVAVLYAFIMGLAIAQSSPSQKRRRGAADDPAHVSGTDPASASGAERV